MENIDLFVYKVESYDSDAFQKDSIAYSDNHIFMQFNKEGIKILHCPPGLDMANRNLKFWHLRLGYLLYPFFFIIDHFRIFWLFLWICRHRHIKVAVIENTYVAVIAGIFRACGGISKLVYIPGDWLATRKRKIRLRSYVGGNLVFPFFDYWACRFSDLVLNCTSNLADARKKFWDRQIAKKEITCFYRLEIKDQRNIPSPSRNRILFLGNVRSDSGLDIVIKSLKQISENEDVILKIVGAKNAELSNLMALARKSNDEKQVEYFGFVERDRFRETFSDVFCGLNLITNEENYASNTLPSKILDYLQFLIPVIATKDIGPLADQIERNRLGLIIKPLEDEFIKACIEIYRNQAVYQKNIRDYINSFEGKSIKDILVRVQ